MRLRLLLPILGSIAAGPLRANPYQIETLALPPGMDPEISGITFTPSGTLVAVNRRGQVWMREREGKWRLFARGMHEPLGVLAESETVVFVMQRPELTQVTDRDGDGRADSFRTISDAFGITDNYHEFSYGLQRDRDGYFVGGLGSVSVGEITRHRGTYQPESVLAEPVRAHRSPVPFRGWIFKITPAGEFIPFASGFRQPVGIGRSPAGEIFCTDSQGNFVPTSPLIHVQEGRFYGFPESLKWQDDLPRTDLTEDQLWTRRSSPAVYIPHGAMGGSPGQPVWDTSGGKFGPFPGQVFMGDITQLLSRVQLEKIGGEYQGGVFPFLRGTGGRAASPSTPESRAWIAAAKQAQTAEPPDDRTAILDQGAMRLAFSPEGELYIGRTVRGWAPGTGGIQKLTWTGEAPNEIHSIELLDDGFRLNFTAPMGRRSASAPSGYQIRSFRYAYHSTYGSGQIDSSDVTIESLELAPDGLSAAIRTGPPRPGFIYEFKTDTLRTIGNASLANPLAFYTVNRLRSGEAYTGPRPVAPSDDAVQAGYQPNPARGQAVYLTFCVACHQPDGTGIPGGAASFADGSGRLAKSDEVLLTSIARGVEEKGMPPFSATLNGRQRRDVLAYVRAAFGKKPGAN